MVISNRPQEQPVSSVAAGFPPRAASGGGRAAAGVSSACRASLYVDHEVGTHREVLCFALGTRLLHKMVSCRRGKWCKHPCWHQPFLPSASGPHSSHRCHRAQTGEQHEAIRHGECQQPPAPKGGFAALHPHRESRVGLFGGRS